MNLIVDIGNSSTKLALFDGSSIDTLIRVDIGVPEKVIEINERQQIERIIVSDVSESNDYNRKAIGKLNIPVHFLTSESRFPFSIDYKSPGTLGTDRLAAVAGAYNMWPSNDVLVIDAGTAVTFDFLNREGKYLGGNISPGLTMRFKALNSYTGKLPLVVQNADFKTVGDDTDSAIRAGVQLGLVFEINEYIRTFESRHKEVKVVLTGGDSEILSRHIEFSFTFAPDLVLEGLNFLLGYNA